MKTKFNSKTNLNLLLLFISLACIMGSCSKETKDGDKTALNTLIALSEQLAANATTDNYPQAAIDEFKATLGSIKAVAATTLSQAEINDLADQLTDAISALESYVPLTSLIAEAENLSESANPSNHPQVAIDNFITVLESVKASYAGILTHEQIEELKNQISAAISTLNAYGTPAYATLYTMITSGESLANSATNATYPQSAIDEYKSALLTIKTAAAELLTETQLLSLIAQLNEATATFDSQQYLHVSLNAGWHFDEGAGSIATAFSTVQHTAIFKPGNAVLFGAEAMTPVWVDGVKNGSAVYLNNGAHLEVNYTTAFLPSDLCISVWVKPDVLYENNYIISQNYWNGYKLQLQGEGKPFFTYKKTDGNIVDADNELNNSVRAGQWTHLAVSVNGTAKELKFYINGILTRTWTESDKGIGPLTQMLTNPGPQPFIIGCVATDAEVAENFMEWTTLSNFGYFKGAIDELKIFGDAMSDGQIWQLYINEKP